MTSREHHCWQGSRLYDVVARVAGDLKTPRWGQQSEAAGLPPISWHAFRRTHATLLSDLGEPLKTAQAQLGHASITTTAEIYVHAVPASQRAAVEKLEQAVLGWQLDPNGPKSEK